MSVFLVWKNKQPKLYFRQDAKYQEVGRKENKRGKRKRELKKRDGEREVILYYTLY